MSRTDRAAAVPCEVCGSRVSIRVLRKFDLWLSRCLRCGFLFASPRLARDDIWQRYSPEYFQKEYLPTQGVQNGTFSLEDADRRYAPMLRLLARYAGSPGDLLEIGAGAGFFLKAAERAGWRIAGTELSAEAVAFASRELHVLLRLEAAEDLSFPSASFDVVVMFDVIEHLLHPYRVVQDVNRLLRPAGLLAVTTPNINALSRFALGRQWAILSPAEHLSYFSQRTLRRLLVRAGFASVTFVRAYDGFGLHCTMNPEYTHEPGSRRADLYRRFFDRYGERVYAWLRARGMGDALLCVARKPAEPQS